MHGPAAGEAYALRVALLGDRGFELGPGETGYGGSGIDRWTVRFEGAARVDGGEGACPVATGLHAIVEVAYEEICICRAPIATTASAAS